MELEKKSFKQRVLEFVLGSDEANVDAIQKMAKTLWLKQISTAKSNIIKLTDKLADDLVEQAEYAEEAKVAYVESFLNIPVEKLTHDARKTYILGEYQQQIATASARVDEVAAKVIALKKANAEAIAKQEEAIEAYTRSLEAIA